MANDKATKPPPYEGDELNMCLARAFDFNTTTAIVVSGTFPNPCGHMVLKVGGADGHYFHTAGGAYSRPKFMRELGFQRYLRENKKRVLSRRPVPITDPIAAQAKLDQLMATPWRWLVLPNNCASFVEEVVQAGGSNAGLYFNCPRAEAFK
jgi:hypothetical protein